MMGGVWCMAGAAAESSDPSERIWEAKSTKKVKWKCEQRQSEQRDLP